MFLLPTQVKMERDRERGIVDLFYQLLSFILCISLLLVNSTIEVSLFIFWQSTLINICLDCIYTSFLVDDLIILLVVITT